MKALLIIIALGLSPIAISQEQTDAHTEDLYGLNCYDSFRNAEVCIEFIDKMRANLKEYQRQTAIKMIREELERRGVEVRY